jgi:acetyltransferase-like isoleucine patch superfamily enzyme
MSVPVILPQGNANDAAATLIQWLVEPGSRVEKGRTLALVETSKVTYEVEAPADGWFVARASPGDMIEIGAVIAEIAPAPSERPAAPSAGGPERKVTAKARRAMAAHGIVEEQLPAGLSLVREQDVLALLPGAATADVSEFDAVFDRADYRQLMDLLAALRRRMKGKYARHVPTGTLLNDRWRLAESLGFGDGANAYDEALIMGDVQVGAHCWIGPYTVLDGRGGLEIGDWTSIGTGAHAYSHHTIDHALTGGRAAEFRAPTRIGRCCFVGPMAVIAPGSIIGDHSFVAALSYVEGRFPPFSYLAGIPAAVVGRVEIKDGRAIRHLFDRRDDGRAS